MGHFSAVVVVIVVVVSIICTDCMRIFYANTSWVTNIKKNFLHTEYTVRKCCYRLSNEALASTSTSTKVDIREKLRRTDKF